MKFRTFMALLCAIIIMVFSLQNATVIDVQFLFWKLSLSRVLVILGSFIIGILFGVLISIKRK